MEDKDPWMAHLEQCYSDRDNGAKASDPEDLRTLMLRRLVVTFGVDSAVAALLVHRAVGDQRGRGHDPYEIPRTKGTA